MDERSWAKNQKTGQNALAHLGSAPEQKLHWRTWEVRQYKFALAHLPSAPRPEYLLGRDLAGLVGFWSISEAWLSH